VLTTLITFLPVAILLTITPGVATVLVIQTAARDGRKAALATTAGNSLGVLTWALAAAVGIATVIAASAVAFTVVKLCGAVVLLWMGVRALLARRADEDAALPARGRRRGARGARRAPGDRAPLTLSAARRDRAAGRARPRSSSSRR